jgi:UDP-glucose 4-epimerase
VLRAGCPEDSMSDYLITGGAGFIGSHIAEELAGEGHRVRIFDNLSSGHLSNLDHLQGKVDFVEGDVRDRKAIEEAMRGMEFCFHEAALVSVFESVEKPFENHEINMTGTLNVLNAARKSGVKRFVFASSAAVYGNDPALPKSEEMRPQPASPYAAGKIAGEYYLSIFAQLYGLQTVSLRYFNVFGPRQDPKSMYSGVISKFTDDIRAGRTPTIFGDGQQTRDFVFVKDVVQANIRAMRSPGAGAGEAFNVATGKTASLLELLRVLGGCSGMQITPVLKEARQGDIRHSSASIAKARSVLGYEPNFSLEAGLEILLRSLGI